LLCDVKRGLGVEAPGVDRPDGGFEDIVIGEGECL
jgi:hypothetical protein